MSTAPVETVPEFDLADRMRKSLRHRDIGVQEMAEYLDVNRNTVGSWINGRITPDRRTILLWAMRTGVPVEWLESGIDSTDHGPGGSTQPTDYGYAQVHILRAA